MNNKKERGLSSKKGLRQWKGVSRLTSRQLIVGTLTEALTKFKRVRNEDFHPTRRPEECRHSRPLNNLYI